MKMIDLHCDTIGRLMYAGDKSNLRKNNFSVDVEKLVKSDSMAQFFALYVDSQQVYDPLKYALDMLDRFYNEIQANSDKLRLATNYEELMENNNNNRISVFLTIEEGGVIQGKLSNLRSFYRLGVRLMTLTWNYTNEIGFPNCKSELQNKGLTEFGIECVREMNNLGMIIDVSHLSDGGFYDVAKYSSKPFVASHSNSRQICHHPRNLNDDMIRVLAEKGGVTGINFEKSFLNTKGRSFAQDIVNHIKHIINIGGSEVVALGTDFDGIDAKGLEIDNIGDMDKLLTALNDAGFSDDIIEKIFYKNALRVIKEVMK